MDAPAIVTLIGVGLAVVAIATYLIIIAMILKRVVNRLVIILGAVGQTTQRSEPIGAVLTDINRDLDSGRATLEACVQRLVQRHGLPANGDAGVEAQAVGAKRPIVRTGYSAASAAADESVTARANLRRGDPSEPVLSEGGVSSSPPATDEPPGREERSTGGRRWWNR